MKLIILSEKFYHDFAGAVEILQKRERPYACLSVVIDGVQYAIPFRHHISHKYAFITYGDCGLDYTKAVIVRDDDDISDAEAIVDQKEWNKVQRYENKIIYEFRSYLGQYRRALKHRNNPRSVNILRYSALQYFNEWTPFATPTPEERARQQAEEYYEELLAEEKAADASEASPNTAVKGA